MLFVGKNPSNQSCSRLFLNQQVVVFKWPTTTVSKLRQLLPVLYHDLRPTAFCRSQKKVDQNLSASQWSQIVYEVAFNIDFWITSVASKVTPRVHYPKMGLTKYLVSVSFHFGNFVFLYFGCFSCVIFFTMFSVCKARWARQIIKK